MAYLNPPRPANPRLGTYYAIFASALAAIFLVATMLDQLGVKRLLLSHAAIAAPLVLCLVVAIAARTLEEQEFFLAGRRVPPVFGGLALAATAIGGVGFFALVGALYILGFDALAFPMGIVAGFAVTAILISPYLYKAGAYTMAGFFRMRFARRTPSLIASLLLTVPCALLLAAELQAGAFVASLFTSATFVSSVWIGVAVICAITVLGGMRSLTWTQCVQYLVILAGVIVPLTIVSTLETNLPVPQITFGGLLERIAGQEIGSGAALSEPLPLAQGLPDNVPQAALKPFLQAFGVLSATDFILLGFCVMAGTAVMPALLTRTGTASNGFEVRHTIAWGALFAGLFLLTVPAYAAFAKFLTLQDIVGVPPSKLPGWIAGLREAGLADFSDKNGDGVIGASELLISRDGVTLALPIMANMRFTLVALVAAAGIVATVAAASAQAYTIGASLSDDLFRTLAGERATPSKRMAVARLSIVAVTVGAAVVVTSERLDLLQVAAWAMSLAASAFLPAITLSIWWARTTWLGVAAAMLAGFGVAAAHMLVFSGLLAAQGLHLDGMLAAVLGVPAGYLAGIGVSLITPAPDGKVAETAQEIRDPGGETLFDRPARPVLPQEE